MEYNDGKVWRTFLRFENETAQERELTLSAHLRFPEIGFANAVDYRLVDRNAVGYRRYLAVASVGGCVPLSKAIRVNTQKPMLDPYQWALEVLDGKA
jgi:hypothetical protein